MLGLLAIMIVVISIMVMLNYLGFDLSAPINIPDSDVNPSISPTGAMSGTVG